MLNIVFHSLLWKIMHTFAVVKKFESKRQWYSRLLLLVFVQMLLLASVHVHQQSSATAPIDCYACLHHIHHDGHLSSTGLTIDSCLLCHFLTTPYMAATVIAFLFSATVVNKVLRRYSSDVIVGIGEGIRLRAPPVCL